MKKLKTTTMTGICLLNLISGVAFGAESNDNPFRDLAKKMASMEPVSPQVDDGNPDSNPFLSPASLTVICGTKSSQRSRMKIPVGNSNKVHGFKTHSGTQVIAEILDFNNKNVIVSIAMKNKELGQNVTVGPLLVFSDGLDVDSINQGSSFFSSMDMNGEVCLLLYSK